ncbi:MULTISPECIES: hypothetical protein [Microbacterium]|uniref:hypothetical protein n=1 Tax=Microbacterium TaxID=33882 RepID=UPI00217D36C0|nr:MULTISPECIES: hypothetical protein [Microbacterium]UWF77862.1 hypothetical protein JSY13_02000 [Microbacterium neungamense]WCM56038.1 hypothetical protein JRG78_02040 [Microbacterium sp. EF45047]
MTASDRLENERASTRAPQAHSRLERRVALDLSIDEELGRGEARAAELPEALSDVLSVLVDHELARLEPLTTEALLAEEPLIGPFRMRRLRHRLDALADMNLVRFEGEFVRPTIAGIGAIGRFSTIPGRHRPPAEQLRALRQAELRGIRS